MLSDDPDPAVAETAKKGLIDALRPFLTVPEVGDALALSLGKFRGDSLKKLRRALEDTKRHSKDEAQIHAMRRLEEQLPQQSSEQRLLELLDLSPWAWQLEPQKSTEFDELVHEAVADR